MTLVDRTDFPDLDLHQHAPNKLTCPTGELLNVEALAAERQFEGFKATHSKFWSKSDKIHLRS